jgi:Cu-Zn family superoxide dismutase
MGNLLSAYPIFKQAVAVIDSGKIKGVVVFTQRDNRVSISIDIKGLKKNAKHGFHIHETGDLREGCNS